ncbi:MAG: hypothetical protein JWQ02_2700, partial [Capsulimonas sp.]|nr:hypothetical protein [Capsulimonas sp.]
MKHYHAPIISAWLALLCVAAPAQTISGGRLPTRWAKDVTLSKALPEYPRPQMVRSDWRNLNGSWEFAAGQKDEAAPIGKTLSGKILVPFPAEAALSGVGRHEDHVWYRRNFTVPSKWGDKRVLLHFGAVNWETTVYVNGKPFPAHKGGYDEWTLDITDALTASGPQEIVVGVDNLVDANPGQAIGKQRLKPGGILYTAATGIWQTVWLEPVSTAHIGNLDLTPDLDSNTLRVTVTPEAPDNVRIKATQVKITALDRGKVVGEATGDAGAEISVPVPSPHLWSPSDPHLYDLRVSLMSDGTTLDTVKSYFAMRKISLGKDDKGVLRPLLNGKFIFQVGTLDQGYWPDGVYTAPTDAALKYDIEITKKLGFNMIRKHAKVEPDRWYYWTDKLGMLVWQDMPQAFSRHTDASKQQFETEM